MDTIQVLEGPAAEAAIAQLNRVVTLGSGEEGSPDVALCKREHAAIAPVIHTGTLSTDILEKFFNAAKTTSHDAINAFGLYSAEEYHCYRLPVTLEAFKALRGTSCGVINFALVASESETSDPDWVVVFDDQLYIAYGSPAFVTALVGSVEMAYQAVEDRLAQLYKDAQGDIPGYARAEINRMGEYLDAAFCKLTQDYAQAEAGDHVFVV
ncbi:MAG: hypothetical protein AAFN12_10355 [Cyanobacteria bacterium J06560_2]